MYCKNCGAKMEDGAVFCDWCGTKADNGTQQATSGPSGNPDPYAPPVTTVQQGNGLGVAGFVLALLALVFCWVPVLDFILWLLGLILSAIGMGKQPRGLAIAGLALSLLGIILIIILIAAVGIFGAMML